MMKFLKELPQIYIISILSLVLLIVWMYTREASIFALMASGFGAAFQISEGSKKPVQQNFDVNRIENAEITAKETEKIE